jgi:hypothetical protein
MTTITDNQIIEIKRQTLKELKDDMKHAIAERCGINPNDIKLILTLSLD